MRHLVFALVLSLSASSVFAGPFGLFRKGGTNNTTQNTGGQVNRPITNVFLGSAQNAANYMASICRMGHFGGNSGYEGVGAGSSPYQAEMNCCFRQKWTPREVGLAQGANGVWYACCRY
jgi:hypothetical protein